jgi:hypothetical protein
MIEKQEIKKEMPKMPFYEQAEVVDLRESLGADYLLAMVKGHFGVLPAVVILNNALVRPGYIDEVIYEPSTKPIKVNEEKKTIHVASMDNVAYLGDSETNFATLTIRGKSDAEMDLESLKLTADERRDIESNPVLVSDPSKLSFHKGDWSLSSGSQDIVNFRAKEIVGEKNSNNGSFNLDLSLDSIKSHIDEHGDLSVSFLVEIAAQQIAATLIEEGKTPIFSQIKLFQLDNLRKVNLFEKIKVDFRLFKQDEKTIDLKLGFTSDEIKFGAEMKAIILLNKLLERMIK